MARPRPTITSKRILASLSFFLFTVSSWLSPWGLEFVLRGFPLRILFPVLTISILNTINAFFIFTVVEKPEASNHFLKTLIDCILAVGLVVHHLYRYQSIIYWLMSTLFQIYVITFLLILIPTEFHLIELFITLWVIPDVQYALDKNFLWATLFSSVILAALFYIKNYLKKLNNDVIVVAERGNDENFPVQVTIDAAADVHVAGSE